MLAIIFLVIAIHLISENAPWWPSGRNKDSIYSAVWKKHTSNGKDIWNSTADDIQAEMSKSFSAPSDTVKVSRSYAPLE